MRNRLMSSVSNFLRRHNRDSLENLSNDMHIQAEQEDGWDEEDNSNPPLAFNATGNDFQWLTNDSIITTDSMSVSSMPNLQVRDNNRVFSFELNCGQRIDLRLIDNDNALEIEYNTEIMHTTAERGKMTLRPAYDEESNASQDNGTHETSNEDGLHSSTDVLQPGHAVFYIQA